MFTIGKLAKKFGLSRSALLYYDSIGLLRASSRSRGDYRLYTEDDAARLAEICRLRQAGLELKAIARVLDAPTDRLASALQSRLRELDDDMARLQEQQRFILSLLGQEACARLGPGMDKDTWVELLRASGYSEDDMVQWHVAFEASAPEKHDRFLEFLGIPTSERRRIRAWSADPSLRARP